MLVLFETPAGFALFKVLDEGKLASVDDIAKQFVSPEKAAKLVKLKAFEQFKDTTEALAATTALVEASLDKGLKKFLKSSIVKKGLQDELAVVDPKLASVIQRETSISCVSDARVAEVFRGIRGHMTSLIEGLTEGQMNAMRLGLGHSLSRYKLKFSPDKVDTMIVQAIGLLDELDKEINTYAMRVKEWYGWHFPELAKLLNDNEQYARVVMRMRIRSRAPTCDFSDVVEDDVERAIKDASIISMGTDMSDEDVTGVLSLCQEVVDLMGYRRELSEYLKARMAAIAPNLTVMVGELVGARLIAHSGSLINLAKQPASTIQILGAEKALFRALKTKHDTPKYGLIYHASLVGQALPKHKGKVSRVLAAKTALAVRVDALGEADGPTIGFDARTAVENRLRQMDASYASKLAGSAAVRSKTEAYRAAAHKDAAAAAGGAAGYNDAADMMLGDDGEVEAAAAAATATPKKDKKSKKDKKDKKDRKKRRRAEEGDEDEEASAAAAADDDDDEEEEAAAAPKSASKKRVREDADATPKKEKKEKKGKKEKKEKKSKKDKK